MEAGKRWILPSEITEQIEAKFSEYGTGKTMEEKWSYLVDFSVDELKKTDYALYKYYEARKLPDEPTALYRALNRRKKKKDMGVFVKQNKNFLNLLCYFAFGKNWADTLQLLNISEDDIEKTDLSTLSNDGLSAKFIELFSSSFEKIKSHIFHENIEEFKKELDKAKNNAKETDYEEYFLARIDLEFIKYLQIYTLVRGKPWEFTAADDMLTQALFVFENFGLTADIGTTKHALAYIKTQYGHYTLAEIYAEEALAVIKDRYEIASLYTNMGIIQLKMHRHDKANNYFDESQKLCRLLISMNPANEDCYYLLATCYVFKMDSYSEQGKNTEARACGKKALTELKTFEAGVFNAELVLKAIILYKLATIEIQLGNFHEGNWKLYLDDAKRIYMLYGDYADAFLCVDLLAGIASQNGQNDIAYSIFKEIPDNIDEVRDLPPKTRAYYIERHIIYLLNCRNFDEAAINLYKLLAFANKNDLKKSTAFANEYLAHIAANKDDKPGMNMYLKEQIRICEELYDEETSGPEQLAILCKIGQAQNYLGDTFESLNIYRKAAKGYKEFNMVKEHTNTYLDIINILFAIGRRDEIEDIYKSIIKDLAGTEFYALQGEVKKGYSEFLYRTGDFEEAQKYLEETIYFFQKYKLFQLGEIQSLLDALKVKNTITMPSEYTFKQLISRLYYDRASTTEPDDYSIRYWYSKNKLHLLQIFHRFVGLKIFLFIDDVDLCQEVAYRFSWLFNYTVSLFDQEETIGGDVETFDFPFRSYDKGLDGEILKESEMDEELDIFGDENKIDKALKKRASLNVTDNYRIVESESKTGTSYYVAGWTFDLPEYIYDFIKKYTAKDLIANNYFFLPITRYPNGDIQVQDIYWAYQCKFFPVYLDTRFSSENLLILHEVLVDIPFNGLADDTIAEKVKNLFYLLQSATKENAQYLLSNFKIEMDKLISRLENFTTIGVVIVEFTYHSKKATSPVIILQPGIIDNM